MKDSDEFMEFWVVWCPTGCNPTVRHKSEEDALTEACRLSTKHPNTDFHVLRALDHVRGEVQTIRRLLKKMPKLRHTEAMNEKRTQ